MQIKAVEKSIIAVVKEILGKFPKINTVITTGHSLGGALAVLCAYDLSHKFKKDKRLRMNFENLLEERKIRCFTFGAPKVGNINFREAFHRRVGIENCIQGKNYHMKIEIFFPFR